MESFVIGIDIGGTMIKGGAFDLRRTCLRKDSIATDAARGQECVLQNIQTLVCRLSGRKAQPRAIGIGIAGVLDRQRSMLLESPNLPLLNQMPLRERLASSLGIPVFLENDANCAALGELWCGAGVSFDNFLLFTIGTGIGSGVILNRGLWTGEEGKAGEFGHMIVNPGGADCACGKKGCLEAEASGSAMVRNARVALASGASSVLTGLCNGDLKLITPEHIYHGACGGDPLCIEILHAAAGFLAVGMANVNNLLDLHRFIIGGGVSAAFHLVSGWMLSETRRQVFAVSKEKIAIFISQLGNDAGMYGAGMRALHGIGVQS